MLHYFAKTDIVKDGSGVLEHKLALILTGLILSLNFKKDSYLLPTTNTDIN